MTYTDLKKQAEKAVVNALLQALGNPAFVGADIDCFVTEILETFYVRENIAIPRLEKARLHEILIARIPCLGTIDTAILDPMTVRIELYRSGVIKIWRTDSDMPTVSELDMLSRVIEVFGLINGLVLRHHLDIQGINLPAQVQSDGFTVTLMPFRDTGNSLVFTIVKQNQ